MKKALCWFRRDLRATDHMALSQALKDAQEVSCVFVFDQTIIDQIKLSLKNHQQPLEDMRLGFIWQALEELNQELQAHGSRLIIRYGNPVEVIPELAQELECEKVFFNRDYEPAAKKRDLQVIEKLQEKEISHQHFKDHVIFEHNQVRTQSGGIYRVYTPYKNRWRELFEEHKKDLLKTPELNTKHLAQNISEHPWQEQAFWEKTIGLKFSAPTLPGSRKWALKTLKGFHQKGMDEYQERRDFPALEGTSNLSAHIRHGLVSVRELITTALDKQKNQGGQTWMNELIWREFYQMILDTHPYIVDKSFKPAYDVIQWRGGDKEFQAWCQGQTGYPLVDAAMRCLNQTGMMHNRLRMVVASFLCKTLLIDWRKGERYFALKLLDFDLAANNGGWQWSSSTGCDAQPYFRIFNPYSQSEKFDKDADFIRLYCPELRELSAKKIHAPQLCPPLELMNAGIVLGEDYPFPVVDYAEKRKEALEMYKVVKSEISND